MAAGTPSRLDRLRLEPGQLRLTAAVPTAASRLDGIAGQDRARDAIAFGLRVQADGYNIAVTGPPASGRTRLVHEMVTRAAARGEPASDWVYVHNFADPRRPRAVSLPPGDGDDLVRGATALVDACRTALPAAFANEAYEARVQEALASVSSARDEALAALQQQARTLGFAVNVTPMGLLAVPLARDGRPMASEVFAALPPGERQPIEERGQVLEERITETVRLMRRLEAGARERILAVDRETTRFVLGPHIDALVAQFGDAGLRDHFVAIEADVVRNIETFKRSASAAATMPPQIAQQLMDEREALVRNYQVNLFVTHGDEQSAGSPVVEERSPTYHNVFGKVEFENRFGSLVTDFTRIRPGAIHLANGGYLVIHAENLLADPRSWPRLKQALQTGEARMEDLGENLAVPIVGLAPMPMPLSLKVILIGPPALFMVLAAFDPEFHALFKVRAEFEPDMPADQANIATYAAYVSQTCEELELRPFEPGALSELLHHGSRLAGRQDRLSARLGLIRDLCTEANQLALDSGAGTVSAGHVSAAADARVRRAGLVPDRIRALIAEGSLHIATEGSVVGQVNGLAVFAAGDRAFGVPTRITCRVGAGRRGVVAIERETERSGSIHTKGVLVLDGFLTGTFGREAPLAFNASLTFEQSYDEVEGDSASSAELYAILAALADVPVRQDIAVTGSVDQLGNIQAVGAVTEKIEGFYDICRLIGLTGTQGVILPATNVRNLTLRQDVVDAVTEGQFHLWAISRVEEGLEILAGLPAHSDPADPRAPEGVFERAALTLERMRRAAAATTAEDGRVRKDA